MAVPPLAPLTTAANAVAAGTRTAEPARRKAAAAARARRTAVGVAIVMPPSDSNWAVHRDDGAIMLQSAAGGMKCGSCRILRRTPTPGSGDPRFGDGDPEGAQVSLRTGCGSQVP